MNATYDRIGGGYDATRRPDPKILEGIVSLLNPSSDGTYLDVACGTGNYTCELARSGGRWFAFDQSEMMLAQARSKSDAIEWRQCDVEQTPYKSDFFDGATCSLALHHFPDLVRAFEEIARVLKPRGRFVTFTSTPEQMLGYWVNDYFPEMLKTARQRMPSLEQLRDAMEPHGLVIRSTRPFFVEPDLEDWFLYSGKQRPEMYLSKKVRDGISPFRNHCSETELKTGLARLESDIETGRINEVMERYRNDRGDYLFVAATLERA